ncbi:hypothetical protein BDZ94DRAFT_1254937 [Collybia nuda]|uniref:Uncharacterized protein n=1 Tax=Collybia nuda TaxID=64659 RepID=A0A9P5YA49_9AGAR|nr:hypothetical protein BDZ94DRAFT_1254937 [Collybia nuda]
MADPLAPLSFPAILRNPGLSGRFAHLQLIQQSVSTSSVPPKKLKRESNEGKRWVRRKDNARFTGNPHIVTATKRDYSLQTPHTTSTFPEPLPPYLPRTTTLPTTVVPVRNPITANAGRFSLSLKGMRRELRKSGFRVEALVRDIEREVLGWLEAGGTMLTPDTKNPTTRDLQTPGTLIGETETIFEVSRTPLQLIWSIADDSFARYIVHCCARYYEIVSFSKEVSGRRLTYLLRPNVTHPDHRAPTTLDTPPVTDVDYSSHPDSDVDHLSELDSDTEQRPPISSSSVLSIVPENVPNHDSEDWYEHRREELRPESVVEDSDIDGDESEGDLSLITSVESLSLASEIESDKTPRADPLSKTVHMHNRFWERNNQQRRSGSSSSRSPAGAFRPGLRPLRYDPPHKRGPAFQLHCRQSFYDFIF